MPPPFLLRGVARAVDLLVQLVVLDLSFRFHELFPTEGLVQLSASALETVDLAAGLGALILYAAVAEAAGGATLGKWLTGMRVIRADTPNGVIGVGAAVLRNTAILIDGLIFGLVAYSYISRSDRGQRVGDDLAGTVVVWRSDGDGRHAWLGWPLGILAATAFVCATYVITG